MIDAASARALAEELSDPHLGYDEALVALSERFDRADAARLHERLDDVARALFAAAGGDVRHQAASLGDALFGELRLQVECDDHRALLLSHALCARSADPLLLAALGHELARRAGFDSVVARTDNHYWTILRQEDCFVPIGYTRPPDSDVIAQPRTCCPHEVGYAILRGLAHRGSSETADAALRVRALLPLRPHAEGEEDEA